MFAIFLVVHFTQEDQVTAWIFTPLGKNTL